MTVNNYFGQKRFSRQESFVVSGSHENKYDNTNPSAPVRPTSRANNFFEHLIFDFRYFKFFFFAKFCGRPRDSECISRRCRVSHVSKHPSRYGRTGPPTPTDGLPPITHCIVVYDSICTTLFLLRIVYRLVTPNRVR